MLLHELIHTITLPQKHLATKLLDGKLVTPDEIDRENEKETSKFENILDALLRNKKHYAKTAYDKFIKTNEKPRRLHNRTTKKNKQRHS
jgi:hypothetical protein